MESNGNKVNGLRQGLVMTFSAIMLVIGVTLPAWAATVAVFGPQEYVRQEGKPTTASSSFSVPSQMTNCRLLISYGANGPLAANNVSVLVNGVEMASAKSLRGANPEEVTAKLQSENTLLVTLKGKPGDSVIVQVLGDMPDRPQYPDARQQYPDARQQYPDARQQYPTN